MRLNYDDITFLVCSLTALATGLLSGPAGPEFMTFSMINCMVAYDLPKNIGGDSSGDGGGGSFTPTPQGNVEEGDDDDFTITFRPTGSE
jgi:hypothetical protein